MLDEGTILLCQGLKNNRTLKNLWLNTNGVTAKSAPYLADILAGEGVVESLYLSINPLGDDGIIELSRGIEKSQHLKRLGISSCAIGIRGAEVLFPALVKQGRVEWLNIGFAKGTYVFNGLCNYLGEAGIALLSASLPQLPKLRFLDITHNQVTPHGLRLLLKSVSQSFETEKFGSENFGAGLVSLIWSQYGQQPISHMEEKALDEMLTRNKERWGQSVAGVDGEYKKAGEELVKEVEAPEFIAEILSVYRTKD